MSNDPRGWFKKYGNDYVVNDGYYVSLLKVANNEKGYKSIERKDLRRGDIVQVKISFAPYRLGSKAAGIRPQLEELMVIRGATEIVSLKVILKVKAIIPILPNFS